MVIDTVAAAEDGTAVERLDCHSSETGHRGVVGGVLPLVLIGGRQDDAGVVVGRPGHVVGVVLADLVVAVHQQGVRIAHPLLVAAQHDGVEDLVQALLVGGGVELATANHGVLLDTHGRGQALVVAGAVAVSEHVLNVGVLAEHEQQVRDGLDDCAAEELGTVADRIDGGFLGGCGLVVVGLEAGQGAHLVLDDGAVEHGQPYALQLLVVRVDETDRLVTLPLGQTELHDAVIADDGLVLVDLLEPAECAAVVGGVGHVRSGAVAVLLGVVIILKAVVRGAVRTDHVGLVGFQNFKASPVVQGDAAVGVAAHRGEVLVQTDVLDALRRTENVHVFDEAVDRIDRQNVVDLVQRFLVGDIGFFSCHYSVTS